MSYSDAMNTISLASIPIIKARPPRKNDGWMAVIMTAIVILGMVAFKLAVQ